MPETKLSLTLAKFSAEASRERISVGQGQGIFISKDLLQAVVALLKHTIAQLCQYFPHSIYHENSISWYTATIESPTQRVTNYRTIVICDCIE